MRKLLFISIVLFLLPLAVSSQNVVVPIVEIKLGGLMGGVQNGKWLAPSSVSPKMPAETEFILIGHNGVEEGGVTQGTKTRQQDVCPDFTRMEFELKADSGVALGSSAKWNPVPRMPKPIDPNSQVYKTVVANFLKRKGIPRPVVHIKEAFRVDLEGDGVEEVVLSATYYKNGLSSDARPGDYSFVIVRKVTGKVVTDHLLEGDFVLRRIKFGAPTENHISAIADLNGDGKMEIVLYGFYYEGDFASAFEMKKGRPVKIKEFEIGCGV
ncbi:MAG: hypothetical protein ABI857_06935 [Acidobacteriota bacterium]